MTGERVERVSPDRGHGHVVTRNELLADLMRTRVSDGHRHVLVEITLDDGQKCAGWLSRVEVDREIGPVTLVAEPLR